MVKVKELFRNRWARRIGFVLLGALGGFAYYYFIGCAGNTCPLTSNPYTSIAYGSLIGLVLSTGNK